MALRSLILVAATLFAAANTQQTSSLPTRFENVTWDHDNWIIHNTYPDPLHYQSRPSLSNGYVGSAFSSLGPFFEYDVFVDGSDSNGWPLFNRRKTFTTIAGFYDVQPNTTGTNFEWLNQLGGESVISGIPFWAGLHVQYDKCILTAETDLDQISNFRSSLDMKRALVSWNYTWTPPQGPAFDLEYSTFINRLYVNRAAVQLSIKSSVDTQVKVIDLLDGAGASRTQGASTGYDQGQATIWSSVQPNWIPYVTAWVYSTLVWDQKTFPGNRAPSNDLAVLSNNASSNAQQITLDLKAGQMTTVSKFLGMASHDAFGDPQSIAKNASQQGSCDGFASQLETHAKQWQSEFVESKVDSFANADGSIPDDPNIIDAQILAVSNPFQLLQNVVGPGAIKEANNNDKLDTFSIAVCGLQSECYAGFVFWDVEVWMQPGLVVSYPEAGRQIANYRFEKYQQARENIKTNYITSQNATTFSPDSIAFPWTSGRFGNCTGTGPCFDYEYHLNGDINLQLDNYLYSSGDVQTFQEKYFKIYNGVAQLYTDLLAYNSSLKAYTLRNATDPDEYANHVDNPAFTMALIDQMLNSTNAFRKDLNMPPLSPARHNIYLPTDPSADIILEYSGMNGSIQVKQADVVLIDDFLNYPNPYTLSDLDFYAGHQSLDGPGMTFGVFSDVAAGYLPSGCAAYTYFLYSSQPYLRAPWYQFSEQINDDFDTNGGANPAYPFLTGVGGAHRVPVFGFLGLKLRNDSLHIAPSLPPQIPNLRFRTIYWQGHPIHAASNLTHTTLQRGPLDAALATAHAQYADKLPVTVSSDPLIYMLTHAAPLVLPNARPDLHAAVPGNVLQCSPATANTSNLPGQIPLAAIDGAVSTTWQPMYANETATLTVDTRGAANTYIAALELNWAHQPPMRFSVAFANETAGPQRVAWTAENVVVSAPYNPATANVVTAYRANITRVELPAPVWGGRYALLSVAGNQDSDQPGVVGASVAEFSVIRIGEKVRVDERGLKEL